MTRAELFRELESKLQTRRAELSGRRQKHEELSRALSPSRPEAEEEAASLKPAAKMASLSRREKTELAAIDQALTRMREGSYGLCLECGEEISPRRLRVVPHADRCLDCEQEAERRRPGTSEPAGAVGRAGSDLTVSPADGMSDRQLEEAVEDVLSSLTDIPTEELTVESGGGTVEIGGLLPSEVDRQIVLQRLRGEFGSGRISDNTRLDPLNWQNTERQPGALEERQTDEEIMTDGPGAESDPHKSRQEGRPYAPPEVIMPEK